MIKHFCDQCGVEITEINECKQHCAIFADGSSRLGGRDRALGFAVMTGNADTKTWNSGDFCKYCVIDAVKSLDDRPTQGAPE